MKRRKPIPRKRAKPRRGPMRDPAYLAFLREHGICAALLWYCDGLCDPAHTENNGMRSKGPDSSCVPLCRTHHMEYDAGRKAFELKYGLDMRALAKWWYAKYVDL
jgi:hypothetical protein